MDTRIDQNQIIETLAGQIAQQAVEIAALKSALSLALAETEEE